MKAVYCAWRQQTLTLSDAFSTVSSPRSVCTMCPRSNS